MSRRSGLTSRRSIGMLLAALMAGAAGGGASFGRTVSAQTTSGAEVSGGPALLRRLSEGQYKRTIADIFGTDIKVPGRFDPPLREQGLLAIGDAKATISASGIEQYELRAREISAQVLSADRRKKLLSCAPPQSPQAFDEDCAAAFFGRYGRLLYRRPLSDREMASTLGVARAETQNHRSFYKGLEFGLARLLGSPNFIFRVERSEPDPKNPPARRLDNYSLATRISFLLRDASPDEELLDAAASGALRDEKGLEKQVDRLIASPRFAEAVRAFFSDMFGYEQFNGLAKDQSIFPKFTSQLAADAQEQTLRTIVDLLVTNKGDYRDLFTTKKTFMNRHLGSLYPVRLDDDGVGGWAPYTFGGKDPRAGILSLASFLMLDPTHEGRTSPTIRGKSLREMFLCQKVPDPPNNVDFTQFQDPKNPNPTVRERLEAHRKNPVCAGCHAMTDPVGLALENYDAIGQYRTMEKGAPIDASGTFDGKPYTNLVELTKILRNSPRVPACVVQRVYEYGVGRQATGSERKWLVGYAAERFAADKYVFPALMRQVAASKAFQAVSIESVDAK